MHWVSPHIFFGHFSFWPIECSVKLSFGNSIGTYTWVLEMTHQNHDFVFFDLVFSFQIIIFIFLINSFGINSNGATRPNHLRRSRKTCSKRFYLHGWHFRVFRRNGPDYWVKYQNHHEQTPFYTRDKLQNSSCVCMRVCSGEKLNYQFKDAIV